MPWSEMMWTLVLLFAAAALGFHAHEAAGDVTRIEDPVIRVSAEDRGYLLLGWKLKERRFVEKGPYDRGRGRSAYLDGSGSLLLGMEAGGTGDTDCKERARGEEWMRFHGAVSLTGWWCSCGTIRRLRLRRNG